MRVALVLLMLALAACGQSSSEEALASEQSVLMGRYLPASDSARMKTGGVAIERGGLMFDTGVVLYTRLLDPRRGSDLVAQGGDSFAAAALGPSDLSVELRRVTQETVEAGARGLCGEERPQYVALAHEQRATFVTMLVFVGEEPPGPAATNSRLCAVFAYAAPDGARTRQGVVLQ